MSTANVFLLPTALDRMSLPDLESELLGLAGHIAAAECRFLQLLAEFDHRDGWAGDGIRSCAHWLSWRAGMNLRTAAERLRVARALGNLPLITDAFACGRVSYSKVRAITRITGSDTATLTWIAAEIAAGTSDLRHTTVADPETAERILLTLALSGTASHVETVVAAVRRRHTPPQDVAARRSLSWQWDEDGFLLVRARLTPEAGAAFIAAIDAHTPAPNPIRPTDPPSPPDLEDRAREQEPGPAADRVAARRADALLTLLTNTSGDEPVERGRAQVILHIDATTGTAQLQRGPHVPAATAARLACDARVQVLLDDRAGNRMYLGRSRRLASPGQITAITVRDEGRCQFPGCTHTQYLQAHHVRHWLHHGPTDVDNLVLICSFHHTVLHDHGYQVRRVEERWEFHRPDGTPIPATPALLSGNTESLIEMNTRAQLRINRDTLTPDGWGDRLDPDPILDALLPRRIEAA